MTMCDKKKTKYYSNWISKLETKLTNAKVKKTNKDVQTHNSTKTNTETKEKNEH